MAYNERVTVWDLGSLQQVVQFEGHVRPQAIEHIRTLASRAGLNRFSGVANTVWSVTFSLDGRLVASCDVNGTAGLGRRHGSRAAAVRLLVGSTVVADRGGLDLGGRMGNHRIEGMAESERPAVESIPPTLPGEPSGVERSPQAFLGEQLPTVAVRAALQAPSHGLGRRSSLGHIDLLRGQHQDVSEFVFQRTVIAGRTGLESLVYLIVQIADEAVAMFASRSGASDNTPLQSSSKFH